MQSASMYDLNMGYSFCDPVWTNFFTATPQSSQNNWMVRALKVRSWMLIVVMLFLCLFLKNIRTRMSGNVYSWNHVPLTTNFGSHYLVYYTSKNGSREEQEASMFILQRLSRAFTKSLIATSTFMFLRIYVLSSSSTPILIIKHRKLYLPLLKTLLLP